MTHTEQIIAAIAAKLTAAGIRNRTDTANPYSYEDAPAIIVDCGNESPRGVIGQGFVYWDLQVTLWIIGMGAIPKLAPESTRVAAHTALYADRSLGGLIIDIQAGAVNRQIDQDNPAAGITEAIYLIQYRAMESTL
jgi:hypothetical protein